MTSIQRLALFPLLVLTACSGAPKAPETAAAPEIRPNAAIARPKPGTKVVTHTTVKEAGKYSPFCESKCSAAVTSVFEYDEAEKKCVLKFAYPCEPYDCDAEGRTCNTSCDTSADCSAAGACNGIRSECVTMGNRCKDAFTVSAPDGHKMSCAPYICLGGACQQQCSAKYQCAPDYSCEGSRCVN
jgi:hypothetical protein